MNNTNDTEQDSNDYFITVTEFHKAYVWVLVAVGVPGNVACILVATSMTLTTATLYMSLLAVADLLALILKLIAHQVDLYRESADTFLCKGEVFVQLVSCYANWTLVLVCFERFLSIRFPLKKKVYFTKKRAVFIAVLMGIILCLSHLHSLIQMDKSEKGDCFFPESNYMSYWYWITTFIYFFLPFILLLIFPCLIIVSLRQQRKAREAMVRTTQDTPGETMQTRVEVALSVMVVCDAIVVFVTFSPTCISRLITLVDKWEIDTPKKWFASAMFLQFAKLLSEANYVVDFWIYFFASKKFRSCFRKLIKKCLACKYKKYQT